ncbi:MAG: hypothetical protein M1834_003190 [Cirrosporium novae-zelandiae]|nr:MAG: hypothetical protein M1834_003190 [Cirrosporium novae-zelandiae]
MASPNPDGDIERKRRIIDHMNADHSNTLALYLQRRCRLPSSKTVGARLEDITLSHLLIDAQGTRNIVPIEPPMRSLADARERLENMYLYDLKATGRSIITIQQYTRPQGSWALLFFISALTFIFFSQRSNFLPGSLLYDMLLKYIPPFARFCYSIQPLLISTMVVIHSGEVFWMDRSRMRKYNVPRFSRLWLTWILSTFIEGFGAYRRVDILVKKAQAERAEAKRREKRARKN